MDSINEREDAHSQISIGKTEINEFHRTYFGHEVRIQIVRERKPEVEYYITNPNDVYRLVKEQLMAFDREVFLVLSLNTKHRVLGLNLVSIGILNQSLIHPREIYKSAILLNAASILLVHNHPAGDPKPSAQDDKVTERLCKAGQLLGIKVLDHVIIGNNSYYSYVDEDSLHW